MIQCFAKKNYEPEFISTTIPKLISTSRIDKQYCVHPRSMHKHDDLLEIHFVREGNGIYIIDNRRYNIAKGDIIVCNSKVFHDEDSQSNNNILRYDLAVTNIHMPGLRENCLVREDIKPIFNAGDYYEDFNNLMYVLFSQLAAKHNYAEKTCHHIMMSILTLTQYIIDHTQLETKPKECHDKFGIIEEVQNYIDQHYCDELTLEELAQTVNLSPYYLSRIFKKETGYSPIQYAVRRRLGEAQTLLIKSDLTITEIASRIGYGNPSYFNVLFTKKTGISPSEYRKIYCKFDENELDKILKTK